MRVLGCRAGPVRVSAAAVRMSCHGVTDASEADSQLETVVALDV